MAKKSRENTNLEWLERGEPKGLYRVEWQKQGNFEIVSREVRAHDMADAAWRVARDTFDCNSSGNWQLLDVIRLA